MSKKTQIQKAESTELAVQVPDNFLAEMAGEAKDTAAKEIIFGSRISFKGGDITINGEPVKDNKLPVIIVDFACEKAYYEGKYDPKTPQTPVCYAMGREEKDLKPHPAAPSPQAENCASCPHNKFGTADVGKGKACKDGRRLLCVAGSTTLDGVQSAEVLPALLPPTSIKGWGVYLKGLGEMGRPPYSVVTILGTKKVETYFHVTFELAQKLSVEQSYMLRQRQPHIEEMLFQPYPAIEAEEPVRKPKGGKEKFSK